MKSYIYIKLFRISFLNWDFFYWPIMAHVSLYLILALCVHAIMYSIIPLNIIQLIKLKKRSASLQIPRVAQGREGTPHHFFRPTTKNVKIHHYFVRHCLTLSTLNSNIRNLRHVILFKLVLNIWLCILFCLKKNIFCKGTVGIKQFMQIYISKSLKQIKPEIGEAHMLCVIC